MAQAAEIVIAICPKNDVVWLAGRRARGLHSPSRSFMDFGFTSAASPVQNGDTLETIP